MPSNPALIDGENRSDTSSLHGNLNEGIEIGGKDCPAQATWMVCE
ncbi:hypothetical protein [Dyella flagellata]|nr:hypothetical protein [Dyella flagellata]